MVFAARCTAVARLVVVGAASGQRTLTDLGFHRADDGGDRRDTARGLRPYGLNTSGAHRASHQPASPACAGWRSSPLRAPPPRANHAVPPGPAARSQLHRAGGEHGCRYVTRPALSDERGRLNAFGQVELKLKTPWRDGTTYVVVARPRSTDPGHARQPRHRGCVFKAQPARRHVLTTHAQCVLSNKPVQPCSRAVCGPRAGFHARLDRKPRAPGALAPTPAH